MKLVFGSPESIALKGGSTISRPKGRTDSYWRMRARPIIARVISESIGKTEKEISIAIRDAYPFGERKYWPYKIWLDEIKLQRGDR